MTCWKPLVFPEFSNPISKLFLKFVFLTKFFLWTWISMARKRELTISWLCLKKYFIVYLQDQEETLYVDMHILSSHERHSEALRQVTYATPNTITTKLMTPGSEEWIFFTEGQFPLFTIHHPFNSMVLYFFFQKTQLALPEGFLLTNF